MVRLRTTVVSADVTLGAGEVSTCHARTTQPGTVPKVSRQAAFYLDTARALAHVRKDTEALRMLLTTERLAPQRMRAPLVRETARGLLERARRGTGWTELRGLCERLGVGA